jgi:hypothetical protein
MGHDDQDLLKAACAEFRQAAEAMKISEADPIRNIQKAAGFVTS